MTTWRDYEEEAAQFFRDLGMRAEMDEEVEGVRGKHSVDVLVTFERIGITQTWIVECKCWDRPVDKLHVLALAAIVQDTGADRGFLLSETGFQSGALRAATRSNVTLTGLEDLRATATEELADLGLRDARNRVAQLRERLAIADDRDHATTPGSGFWVASDENISLYGRLSFAERALSDVHLGRWPLLYGVDLSHDRGMRARDIPELADGLGSVLDLLEAEVVGIEEVLRAREHRTQD